MLRSMSWGEIHVSEWSFEPYVRDGQLLFYIEEFRSLSSNFLKIFGDYVGTFPCPTLLLKVYMMLISSFCNDCKIFWVVCRMIRFLDCPYQLLGHISATLSFCEQLLQHHKLVFCTLLYLSTIWDLHLIWVC